VRIIQPKQTTTLTRATLIPRLRHIPPPIEKVWRWNWKRFFWLHTPQQLLYNCATVHWY